MPYLFIPPLPYVVRLPSPLLGNPCLCLWRQDSTSATTTSEEPPPEFYPSYMWQMGKWPACVALTASVLLIILFYCAGGMETAASAER
jgi:hypothetical protein